MNVLVIGNGGREHALVKKLSESPEVSTVYCSPANPGIAEIAEEVRIDVSNFNKLVDFCRAKTIDLVVVGPEKPLADGIADALFANHIAVFGPVKQASKLESSKEFAKEVMKKHNIPTASYRSFTPEDHDEAHQYIDGHSLPVVLKADGLAGGKGVFIAEEHKQAHTMLDEYFGGRFGNASKKVVVEEFLKGEEASVFAICDGSNYITLAPSQDHKRILEGDRGANTGGMGAYAPAPVVTDEVLQKVKTDIIEPVLKEMSFIGAPYIGCLYIGLMIKDGEPNVIEFNVRFGDPEVQSVLQLFKGDFAKLLYSAAQGSLIEESVEDVNDGASATVILASEGYPGSYNKGKVIKGIDEAEKSGVSVFQAGTKEENGNIITSGGRVLGVTSKAGSIDDAFEMAYKAVDKIDFENKYYRRDIGNKVRTR